MKKTNLQRLNKIGKAQKEPDEVRVFYKDGNATMQVCKKINYTKAILIESRIRRLLREQNVKLEGMFIYSKR